MQYMIVGKREALYYMRCRTSEHTLALIRKSRISGVGTGTFEESMEENRYNQAANESCSHLNDLLIHINYSKYH